VRQDADKRSDRYAPRAMIAYQDKHEVDLDALGRLRDACAFATRTRAELARQLAGARWVVSAWDGARLVGFARAFSDGVTNAYVSSVMVDAEYRRRGIGRELLRRIVEGRETIRFVLHARRDAMPFYRALGFTDAPDMMWRDPTR
jgi:ribosomal protein S18 acetylase RimI-like enzyme